MSPHGHEQPRIRGNLLWIPQGAGGPEAPVWVTTSCEWEKGLWVGKGHRGGGQAGGDRLEESAGSGMGSISELGHPPPIYPAPFTRALLPAGLSEVFGINQRRALGSKKPTKY